MWTTDVSRRYTTIVKATIPWRENSVREIEKKERDREGKEKETQIK